MPNATITDWVNGPMGPGFFIMFPAHVTTWYDGGGMYDFLPREADEKREERLGELFALIWLMREQ